MSDGELYGTLYAFAAIITMIALVPVTKGPPTLGWWLRVWLAGVVWPVTLVAYAAALLTGRLGEKGDTRA